MSDPQDLSPHAPCVCGHERSYHHFAEYGQWPCECADCECEDFELDFENEAD